MSPTDTNPGQVIEPQIKETFSGTQQAKLERLLSKDPMSSSVPQKKNVFGRKVCGGKIAIKKKQKRTSLVVQWIRTRLPIQGTSVLPLVREDWASKAREARLLEPASS